MAEESPRLARQGLLRWRMAMLRHLTLRTPPPVFDISETVRIPALIDIQTCLRERRNTLPQLLDLFDRIHSPIVMTKAI
jgi:hypothetical protein